MCAPIAIGIISGLSSVAGAVGSYQDAQAQANYSNQVAARDYKYAVAKREGEWNQALSIWNSKKVDYQNDIGANQDAAGRAYSAEQMRFNEMFQQAAFQKQDQLAQLIQSQGSIAAAGRTGKTAARLDQAALAAFGRNNAIMSENLASARNAMMQRNEDTRLQLMGANNRAWSQVAIAPTPGLAPPVPIMASGPNGIGLVSGILGGIATGASGFMKAKAPDAGSGGNNTSKSGYTFNPKPDNPAYQGPAFGPSYKPYTPNQQVAWGGNSYNYRNSSNWLT